MRPRPGRRPSLEPMEPRVVLSPTLYTVNSTGDGTSGSGTSGTLPYVISQANVDTNPDGSEIAFDPTVFASPQTITLGATLTLSETAGPEVIEGPGNGRVSISGGGSVRVMDVESGVTATVSGLTISDGSAAGGGGVYVESGADLGLSGCTISGNSGQYSRAMGASSGGGGISNEGTVTLTDCTISGNSDGGQGGGIRNEGTVTLTDCTISGNSDGGLENDGAASLTLTDCTISGNSGTGLTNSSTGTLTLLASTISYNSTGGIYNYPSGKATLTDTIVAGNTENADYEGDILGGGALDVTGSYNMTGVLSGGMTDGVDGNIVVQLPVYEGVGSLGDYGGPTQTVDLVNYSQAIGAGTPIPGITTDQRGDPLDSPPDIGAYQQAPGTLHIIGIAPVTPNPRTSSVSSITVTLNEPAASGGFPTDSMSLIVDQGVNLINDAVTVTQVSGSTYTINGLSGPTSPDGIYILYIAATAITDPAGNPGSGSRTITWTNNDPLPYSTVNPLPSQAYSASFPVSVTASGPSVNAANPVAIASIAIYDSMNGGPFQLFTTVTPDEPPAVFTGQLGATYGFYSVATDVDGDVQPTPAVAQVTTTLINPLMPTPTPTPAVIVGQQPVSYRKLNKKGHPVGKAVLSGFTLDFASPLDPADATDSAHYQVDTVTIRKVKRRVEHILRPITGFTVSLSTAGDAVTIVLAKPLAFTTGGQITVLPGVTGASGGPLAGNTVFAISRGGASVEPG